MLPPNLTPLAPISQSQSDKPETPKYLAVEFVVVALGVGVTLSLLGLLEYWGHPRNRTAKTYAPTLAQRTNRDAYRVTSAPLERRATPAQPSADTSRPTDGDRPARSVTAWPPPHGRSVSHSHSEQQPFPFPLD